MYNGESPWQGINKRRRFNWYFFHFNQDALSKRMDDESFRYRYASSLYHQLDGTFCENEWVFRQFLAFYDVLITEVEHQIIEARNMTYKEYDEYMFKVHGHRLNQSWYVFQWEITLLDMPLYMTDQMLDGLYDSMADYDIMIEYFAHIFYGAWQLIKKESSYLITSNEDIDCIYQILRKICNAYIPLYVFIVEGDYDGHWTEALTQYVKDKLFSYVTFKTPLEQLEWTDIRETGYLFYYYLVNGCGYPGKLANTDTEDDKLDTLKGA